MTQSLLVVASIVAMGAALGTGCGRKRIAECDDLVTTSEKVAACNGIDDAGRTAIGNTVQQLKDTLARFEGAGGVGGATSGTVEQMRKSCRSETKVVVEYLKKTAPDCLK